MRAQESFGLRKSKFWIFQFSFHGRTMCICHSHRSICSLFTEWLVYPFFLFPLAMLDSVLNTKKMARGYIGLLSLHRKLRLPTKGVFSATRICKHIVLYYRLSIPSCNPHNTETQIGCDPQREILRMRANPACVSKSAWH
jgi:hypothetical protein